MTDVPATAPLLPEDAVLLHIGPYKTGTTAIQAAMFARQADLGEHGVAYPGNWRRLYGPGHALLGWAPRGRRLPPIEKWDAFAAEVRALDDRRVCISTEDFGRIRNVDRVEKILEDLGHDRVHVVSVARAYHRVLPSHWQERVKSHHTMPYEEWLGHVVGEDREDPAARSFHTSHDIRQMTSVWLPYLPPERITVICTDDSDRTLLVRCFEQMLGLPEGFLVLDNTSNASLSFQTTEMLRAVNAVFAERGWSDESYIHFTRRGLVRALQERGRAEGESPIPPLPAWARDRVRELSEDRIAALRETGVNVVGDPSVLLPPEDVDAPESVPVVDTLALESAVTAVTGVIEQAVRIEEQARAKVRKARKKRGAPAGGPTGDLVSETSSKDLLREVARRQRQRWGRR